MRDKKILLTLAIPTNGVTEWVLPVLESIFSQAEENDDFEVVITDNGKNEAFRDKITEYQKRHQNLFYKKTDAYLFLNQIEAFKEARGEFIKFVNHRTVLRPGMLKYLLDFARDNIEEKPITYFMNGNGTGQKRIEICNNFDDFVRTMSYRSSWSGGICCWKTDLHKIIETGVHSTLYPHIAFIFTEKNRSRYIVDNTRLFEELSVEKEKKAKYDLFFAFGVEYLGILCNLLRNRDISPETFLKIKKDQKSFIVELYIKFVILKKKASFDTSSFQTSLEVFYSYSSIKWAVFPYLIKYTFQKLKKRISSKEGDSEI